MPPPLPGGIQWRPTTSTIRPRRTRPARPASAIVTDGNNGTNWPALVVAVLAIIILGILGYLFIGAMDDGGGDAMPDEVNVDVQPESGGEG